MKKYYIGFLVLGLVTLGLAAYVLNLGIQGKQDKQTSERAQEIADKLNDYVEDKQKIPTDLEEVGITDVPSTISYTKQSGTEYKFCVTYKNNSSGFGSADVYSVVSGVALQGSGSGFYSDSEDDYRASMLYIGYGYDKGENCQTIEPYIYEGDYIDDVVRDEDTDDTQTYGDDAIYDTGSMYDTYCSTAANRAKYKSTCDYLEEYSTDPQTDEL